MVLNSIPNSVLYVKWHPRENNISQNKLNTNSNWASNQFAYFLPIYNGWVIRQKTTTTHSVRTGFLILFLFVCGHAKCTTEGVNTRV